MSRKSLLLQARHDKETQVQEYNCFLKYSEVEPGQLDYINVFETPMFPSQKLDEYDAFLIGGTSGTSVLEPEKYDFFDSIYGMVNRALEHGKPTFASCFGFQVFVIALGGKITHEDDGFEMGTIPIKVAGGIDDPLFNGVPSEFLAVSVHQQSATELPGGCELLAFTDKCIHSFKVNNKPIWTFQFHPEVDKETLVERLTRYKERYLDDDNHLDSVLSGATDTPEAHSLIKNFSALYMK